MSPCINRITRPPYGAAKNNAIYRHFHLQHLDLAGTNSHSSHPKLQKFLCTMQLRSKVLQIDSFGLLNRCLPELRARDPCTAFVAKGKLTNPSHSKPGASALQLKKIQLDTSRRTLVTGEQQTSTSFHTDASQQRIHKQTPTTKDLKIPPP